MIIDTWLASSTQKLRAADINSARLDCLILLEDLFNKDRAWLLAHLDTSLSSTQLHTLENKLNQRIKHEPLAYIRGLVEFYGRDFLINSHVLVPRPESETIIDLLNKLCLPTKSRIFDIGTGSGALAVTAQLELPQTTVAGTDIDRYCINVAEKNTKKHKLNIKYYRGDLLEAVPTSLLKDTYTVMANLPYVPDSFTLNNAALNEPKRAIFGGIDGLDLYRTLFRQVENASQKPLYVLAESLPFQHNDLRTIAHKAGYRQIEEADFIQIFTCSA